MFAIKEHDRQGNFIGASWFHDKNEAIELSNNIKSLYPNFIVFLTEVDYNDKGLLWELIIHNPQ